MSFPLWWCERCEQLIEAFVALGEPALGAHTALLHIINDLDAWLQARPRIDSPG